MVRRLIPRGAVFDGTNDYLQLTSWAMGDEALGVNIKIDSFSSLE